MTEKLKRSSRKIGSVETAQDQANLRSEQKEVPDKARISHDRRPWFQRGNPKEGVPVPESFYHVIDKPKGKRYFELHQKGFSDPAKRDLCVTREELLAFGEGRNEWTKLSSELEPELLRRLKSGELLARGINTTASLDSGRQVIEPERWLDLCLHSRESSATGSVVYVTHILITRRPSRRSEAQVVVRVRAS